MFYRGVSHFNRAKSLLLMEHNTVELRGSNTDGSFTMAVSNLFLSPLEKSHHCRFRIIRAFSVCFFFFFFFCCFFYIENGIFIIIAWMRRF